MLLRPTGEPYYGSPATIVSSVTPRLWCRADRLVTIATGVSIWGDLFGNSNDFAQATGGSQPAYNATGGPRGLPIITGTFAGYMISPWNPPAPGTTNIFVWAIARLNTWTSSRQLYGAATNRTALQCRGVTPQVSLVDALATGPSANMTVGSWVRVRGLHTGSTSDSLKVGGAAAVTGTNVGNTDSSSFAIFGSTSGAVLIDASLAEIATWTGAGGPTAAELSALDQYATARYGPGLV